MCASRDKLEVNGARRLQFSSDAMINSGYVRLESSRAPFEPMQHENCLFIQPLPASMQSSQIVTRVANLGSPDEPERAALDHKTRLR